MRHQNRKLKAGGGAAAELQAADSQSGTSTQTRSGAARLAWESKHNLRVAAAPFWSIYKAACSAKQIEASANCENTSANLMHLANEGIYTVASADAGRFGANLPKNADYPIGLPFLSYHFGFYLASMPAT